MYACGIQDGSPWHNGLGSSWGCQGTKVEAVHSVTRAIEPTDPMYLCAVQPTFVFPYP